MIKSVKIKNLQKLTIPRIDQWKQEITQQVKKINFTKIQQIVIPVKKKKYKIIITTHKSNKLNSITRISFT